MSQTNELINQVINDASAYFKCDKNQIKNINHLSIGMTNNVFSFDFNGGTYVYRLPGIGSDALVDRGRETIMQAIVSSEGIDDTLIAINVNQGWRLAKYIEHYDFDYHNKNDMVRGILLLKKLHSIKPRLRWDFDVIKMAEKIKAQIPADKYGNFDRFEEIKSRCYQLNELAKQDEVVSCYIHGDARDVNFLINEEKIYLIDWEYSGYGDPGFDIGSYICGGDHSQEEVDDILFTYFKREPSEIEKRHFYAYIAITGWFYLHWTMLKESVGQKVGHNKTLWYNFALNYSEQALKMYKGENK